MINFETANKDEIIKDAKLKARQYCLSGFHCSESIIRALVVLLELDVSSDFIKAACGFRGGGGGEYDRCGIIEVGIMIISYLYGRIDPSEELEGYSYLIGELHTRLKKNLNLFIVEIFYYLTKKKD